ncbi:hypothetical protein HOLleu_38726 [Holothuria leucospilota]|uniref:Uncharacterized protein n=1 Tax=Holothuria leucospilota TaxID=206669 RepID=A0A9Q0YHF5_HOLLE|nr:hypothetical protein HOLleu_38726 [Holothuria leucospilota]
MSKTENLEIGICQDRNGGYRFVMLRGRTLLFLVEVKGHLRSPEVELQKPCKWLVITISQDSNESHFSYLVCKFAMLRGKTLSFLVEVKVIWGYQRSKNKISQEFPRLSSGVTGIKSNISQEFSRLSSGVTIG